MKLKIITFICGLILVMPPTKTNRIFSQEVRVKSEDFRKVVEQRLSRFENKTTVNGKIYVSKPKFEDICRIDTDAVENRVFREYGAIFVTSDKLNFPTKCIFQSEVEVQYYQSKAKPLTQNVGGVEITLQQTAMEALLKSIREAAQKKLRITPRGGSLAAGRSYEDTVRLWNSRFYPALNHWVRGRKISRQEADAAAALPIRKQVAQVLEWESKGWFFSKDLTKSILFSVAAPGASQHNFLLALDVEQFANKGVRKILADNGWFQTVKSDLPHFTYLGVKETELPALGLKETLVGTQKFWIPNFDL
jgi:hypothetical protein